MFGGINPKNSQVSMGGVTHHETNGWFSEFAKRGIKRINISPQRTDTPDGADWLAIKPGTDTAMMLGLAFVIDEKDLLDKQFIERNTVGYDTFREYLTGNTDGVPKTPEWASAICGIDAAIIRELAVELVKTRSLITLSWSLQRAEHGEQPYWMAATLAAMVGQIGLPGGGIGYGYGAIGGVQPGEPFNFNGQSLTYPDIKLVYWCGGNPFHHHQDLHRLNQAWQRPQTIIVNEPWWTATAQRADIVFPATTPYERHDIARAQGDSYLFDMPALIPPVG